MTDELSRENEQYEKLDYLYTKAEQIWARTLIVLCVSFAALVVTGFLRVMVLMVFNV
jgi:hypothetical protein